MGATEATAKAIEKFLDVTGEHLRPFATRRQAKAEADKIETIARAEATALDLKQRAAMEREVREIQFQANIEAIREKAKAIIVDRGDRNLLPANAGEGQSDPDWFIKFTEWSKETSDVDVQALWSKVLAGEVVQPGRFSLRLLHLIRVLRKSDAEKFQRLSRFVWIAENGERFALQNSTAGDYMTKTHGVDFRLLSSLQALGLVRDATWDYFVTQYNKPRVCSYNGHWMTFTWIGGGTTSFLDALYLTELGAELHDVANAEPEEDYLRLLLSKLEAGNVAGWTLKRHSSPPSLNPDRWHQKDDRIHLTW